MHETTIEKKLTGSSTRTVLCGAVLADKPEDISSTNMVSLLRRELNIKRIGHTGILDRSARGLMILLVGRATGFANFFLHGDKDYIADFYFGKSTDTHDREGKLIEEVEKERIWEFLTSKRQKIEAIISKWVDLREQRPPMYSALKKGGKRLSDYARAGKEIELNLRPIQIYESRLLDYEIEKAYIRVYLRVSGGTYVRSLARDLGEELGFPVHIGDLQRVAVGPHCLDEHSWRPTKSEPVIIPVQKMMKSWSSLVVTSKLHEQKIISGMVLPLQVLSGQAPMRIHQNFFIENEQGQALAWAVRTSRGYRYHRILV